MYLQGAEADNEATKVFVTSWFKFQNADPIWLHQNEMWEYIDTDESDESLF